jgi:multidrug resistance protein MdtO
VNIPSISLRRGSFLQGFWQDLQPTPGRLHSSLRITLATVLALILFLVWQMPYAAFGLYAVFLISRESPTASLRLGIAVLMTVSLVVAMELAMVVLTDNDPIARVLGVSAVAFLAGMVIVGTSFPALGSSWGLLSITVIGFWENHLPADTLVKNSLRFLAAFSLGIGCAVAVEYIFGARSPVERLTEQFRARYEALERMFSLYAQETEPELRIAAATPVSRLAVAGQVGMMDLYNQIVNRGLDTRALPLAARVHITMLAELMDDAAAFGLQASLPDDTESRLRCGRIATQCHSLAEDQASDLESRFVAPPTGTSHNLLDRVERIVSVILLMPSSSNESDTGELVGLPSKKVPVIIPGAMRDPSNIAFSLKLSLCATLCYISYHAVDWPGISTCVITVMVAGLTTTGEIKQRMIHRFLGATIGGLIVGLGTIAFLSPNMDSITSLLILVGVVAFISGWVGGGSRFSYVGLQLAFGFYFVTLQGSSAATALAPARDRIIGIFFALVVMWFVFDQMWPVRTVTLMRSILASILRSAVGIFSLLDSGKERDDILRATETLRDKVGKDIATLRALGDAAEYEFGADREKHAHSSEAMLAVAMTAAGIIWNQLALLRDAYDAELVDDPSLVQMRKAMADTLDAVANAVIQKSAFSAAPVILPTRSTLIGDKRFEEYTQNTVKLFEGIETMTSWLSHEV